MHRTLSLEPLASMVPVAFIWTQYLDGLSIEEEEEEDEEVEEEAEEREEGSDCVGAWGLVRSQRLRTPSMPQDANFLAAAQ
jgi:hypothetical protein